MNKITLLFTIIIGVIQTTSAQTFTAGSYKYRVKKKPAFLCEVQDFWFRE